METSSRGAGLFFEANGVGVNLPIERCPQGADSYKQQTLWRVIRENTYNVVPLPGVVWATVRRELGEPWDIYPTGIPPHMGAWRRYTAISR